LKEICHLESLAKSGSRQELIDRILQMESLCYYWKYPPVPKKHFDSSCSGIWNFSQDATPLIIFFTLLSEDVLSLFQEELQILIDCSKRMKTRKALKLDRKLILAFFEL